MRLVIRMLCWLLLLTPLLAQAWGQEGHRVTGYLAASLLNSKAQAAVATLLAPGENLADAATWMDSQRGQLGKTVAQWHFDDKPVCGDSAYCADGNCASHQIGVQMARLANTSLSTDERSEALHMLVHMIGDIQQPLHAADHNDRGGNDIRVTIDGKHSNLHHVWDTEFVRRNLHGDNEAALATQLHSEFQSSLAAWAGGNVNDWINESNQLARTVAYGQIPGFNCSYSSDGSAIALPDSYIATASQTVRQQLAKGGARIAAVLNQVLGHN